MIGFLRTIAQALAAQDSPKQLAAGFALGAAVGLIPKASLLAQLLLILLTASEASMATGALAMVIFAALGYLLDPVLHPIGAFLLGQAALHGLWTWLYNLPIVPWTEFNNTVVLGAFVFSAAIAYPLYRAMIPAFEKYGATIGAHIRRFKVMQLLLGANVASKFTP